MAAPSVLQSHVSSLCTDKFKLLLSTTSQLPSPICRGCGKPRGQLGHAPCNKEVAKLIPWNSEGGKSQATLIFLLSAVLQLWQFLTWMFVGMTWGRWRAALSASQPAWGPANQDVYAISLTQSALPSSLYSLPGWWVKQPWPFCRTEIGAEMQALTPGATEDTEQLNLDRGFSWCPCSWKTHHCPRGWQGTSCMGWEPPGTGNGSPSSCQGSSWDEKAVVVLAHLFFSLLWRNPTLIAKCPPNQLWQWQWQSTLWSRCHSPRLKMHLYNHQHGDHGWYYTILRTGISIKNVLAWIW